MRAPWNAIESPQHEIHAEKVTGSEINDHGYVLRAPVPWAQVVPVLVKPVDRTP